MNKKPKIIAVLIAYKAENTLKEFWDNFPKNYFDEIILIDDASGDKTFEIAKKLKGLEAYQNKINLGYGGNLKECFSKALDRNADVIFEIHPDNEYKYNPKALDLALEKINKGIDFILGNRFAKGLDPIKSGMRVWKYIPSRVLNFISNIVLMTNLSDLHQGFRVYTRELLENVEYKKNSDNYLFSFELITQARYKKFKIEEIPVEVFYTGEKRGASLKNSFLYTLGVFKILLLYLLAKTGVKNNLFK